jgi:hypothetical protein
MRGPSKKSLSRKAGRKPSATKALIQVIFSLREYDSPIVSSSLLRFVSERIIIPRLMFSHRMDPSLYQGKQDRSER